MRPARNYCKPAIKAYDSASLNDFWGPCQANAYMNVGGGWYTSASLSPQMREEKFVNINTQIELVKIIKTEKKTV